jgi:hypothetical protein
MAYNDRDKRRNAASRIPLSQNALRGIPSANAITDTGQGQTLIPSRYGTSSAVLPPDQNPAYQAALSRGRLQRGDLTTITTPSGGTITVPSASAGRAAAAVRGSQVTQIGNQLPIDRTAAYNKGYGEPNPIIQPSASGPVLAQGGVANPIENLTSQQRGQYGVGGFLDSLRSSPVSLALGVNNLIPDNISPIGIGQGLVNAASRIGQGVANFFGGTPANAAPAPSPDALPAPSASPTPIQTPVPTATPSPTAPQVSNTDQQPPMTTDYQLPAAPRRYSDYY